jgi:hypothetical protein
MEIWQIMYQTSIEGIRDVLKECWNIYQLENKQVNYFQRQAALKLAKGCNEAIFHLVDNIKFGNKTILA